MTEGTNRRRTAYWGNLIIEETREEREARKRAEAIWHKYRPAVDLALDEFLATGEWPDLERFRRKLAQRDLNDLNPEEMLRYMPRPSWERNTAAPDRIILSLQALQGLPEAEALLGVCLAMVQKAYELYISDTDGVDQLCSGDPALLSAAGGNAGLLLHARRVLEQHPPSPLGGGETGPEPTTWSRWLHQAVMPAFRDITTIQDYLNAQTKIINKDWLYSMPRHSSLMGAATQAASPATTVTSADLFVIMPFGQAWSDGTYAFIRRAVNKLEISQQAHLYRADEITTPGQISEQVKDAITSARVVIADITGVNPNVMWELGYADGLGKAIVILNQNTESSPFDMQDRRQVTYRASPTDADETNLVRHLEAAPRAAGKTDSG